jgi:hypothetical protein
MNRPGARTRAWISIARAGSFAFALGGCTLLNSPVPPGRPVGEVYGEKPAGTQARPLVFQGSPSPGQAERTRPVIYPPKILAVWVPEHLDPERDFKIGSHYVFIKLRDSSWMEEDIDREPFAKEAADPSDLEHLRSRAGQDRLGRILVPTPPAGFRMEDQAKSEKGKP